MGTGATVGLVFLGKSHRSSDVHETVIADLEGAAPDNVKLEDLRLTAAKSRDALLLHEVVELWLHEDDPKIDILDAHIIATTFERYLKGTLLNVAVEDFFLDWPQPSAQEVAEQQKAEMEEQQKAFAVFIDDDDVPDNLDEDVDDLPMDSDGTPPKKKKKVAKAQKEVAKPEKSKEGKLFRTKDGEYYRIVYGKKIRVKKKTE